MRTHRFSSKLWLGVPLGVCALPLLALSCGSAVDGSTGSDPNTTPQSVDEPQGVPVIAEFAGEFDGENFHLWPISTRVDQEAEIGSTSQALIATLDAGTSGTGTVQTGTSFVAVEQMAAVAHETAWPATHCGPAPAGGAAVGTCAPYQMRNMFADLDLTRAYFEITVMTPKSPTTAVTAVGPSSNTDSSTAEPTLGVSGVNNGLWRYGLLERSTPEGNGPVRWWAFTGTTTTPGSFKFTFTARARGALLRPTVRVGLVNGALDQAPYYATNGAPANGVTAYGLDVTPDGRYAVFTSAATNVHPSATTSGTRVYRKDMQTGAIDVVPMSTTGTAPGSCSSQWPSMSSDGNKVAFQSTCNLGYGTGTQVYVRNISAGTTTLVSHLPGAPSSVAATASTLASISADGNYVAFQSTSADIDATRPAARTYSDVYRYSVATGNLERANVPKGQPTVGGTWPDRAQVNAKLSGDGRYVVFVSGATNMLGIYDTASLDVFLYDTNNGGTSTLKRLSQTYTGAFMASNCQRPAIAQDASLVTFVCSRGSSAPQFVASPTSTAARNHIYARDLVNDSSLEMIDVSADGTAEGDAAAALAPATISTNGRLVAFASTATNLIRTTSCTPSCMTVPAAVAQAYIVDRSPADPDLAHAYVASMIQTAASASPPFAPLPASVLTAEGIGLAGNTDAAYVLFLAPGSGADFGQFGAATNNVFMAPVGDPLFQ